MKKKYRSTIWEKLREWFWRYLPAEIAGTFTALLAASAAYASTNSLIAAAFAGSLGEAVGYYGAATYREIRHYYQKHHGHKHAKRIGLTVAHTLRGLVIEFGPAEAIDGVFLRPYLLYSMPLLLHNTVLGWLVGKLIADVFFYAFAGIGYELRKAAAKRAEKQPLSADPDIAD